MTFDEIRLELARAREELGLSLEQAARRISAEMKRRSDALPPQERGRVKVSISRGGLFNWEAGRSRPSFEDLGAWAATFGLRAVHELAAEEEPATAVEFRSVASRLAPADQRRALLYAKLLAELDGVPLEMLRGYVDLAAGQAGDKSRRSAG